MPTITEGQGIGFDSASVRQIEAICRIVIEADRARRGPLHDLLRETSLVRLAKNGGSTIPARSGTTPGSGSVTLYKVDTTTLAATTEDTVTAYNLAGSTIAANAYLMLVRIGNKWWVMFEDCS